MRLDIFMVILHGILHLTTYHAYHRIKTHVKVKYRPIVALSDDIVSV
jgi:hypothetical protein